MRLSASADTPAQSRALDCRMSSALIDGVRPQAEASDASTAESAENSMDSV